MLYDIRHTVNLCVVGPGAKFASNNVHIAHRSSKRLSSNARFHQLMGGGAGCILVLVVATTSSALAQRSDSGRRVPLP